MSHFQPRPPIGGSPTSLSLFLQGQGRYSRTRLFQPFPRTYQRLCLRWRGSAHGTRCLRRFEGRRRAEVGRSSILISGSKEMMRAPFELCWSCSGSLPSNARSGDLRGLSSTVSVSLSLSSLIWCKASSSFARLFFLPMMRLLDIYLTTQRKMRKTMINTTTPYHLSVK